MRWALWERDNVVFHAETGDTHLLSELPTLVLELLQERDLTTRQVCELTARACAVTDDAPWQEKILAVLGGLEGLELVERGPIAPS